MLPPETLRVWEFAQNQPSLNGLVLVGGSALALRIQHRRSEDLDLACLDPRLPRERMHAFLLIAEKERFDYQRRDNEAALEAFDQQGLELHDYQQDFVVNGLVKVSFFVADGSLARILSSPAEAKVRVATLEELFKAKCLVAAIRSKTRDWLDLYVLMRSHGFTIVDFARAFDDANATNQRDTALARLCSGVPQRDDEGYAHLLENPPTLEEMTSFFREQRNLLEIKMAAEAKSQAGGGH